jgi:GNAT superfamily N-acetyltransferase
MIRIAPPASPEDWEAARRLCWDYRDFLLTMGEPHRSIVERFYPESRYSELMAELDRVHAPPTGGLQLAMNAGQPVGCGMFHTIAPGVAEIKRLFVRDAHRGTGLGRSLAEALVAQCRDQGFEMIRLDTGTQQIAARALYLDMGFVERDAYYEVPDIAQGHMWFFEMPL